MDDFSAEKSRAFLPCLNSGISTEIPEETPLQPLNLTAYSRKTAFILQQSIHHLSSLSGLEKLGFLTLTFSQHIVCPKEAQKRLNSLITHVIKPRYSNYVGVLERQKSGRIHYHLLVTLSSDIRTGVDFKQLSERNYSSAGASLRAEWSFWRQTAKKYGFGRTELLPVRSSIEAMAKYVGKYISKHLEARQERDKGVRLVRYSQSARIGTTRFQWNSNGSANWRLKLKIFAHHVTDGMGIDNPTMKHLSEILGPRWAYRYKDLIMSIPTDTPLPS